MLLFPIRTTTFFFFFFCGAERVVRCQSQNKYSLFGSIYRWLLPRSLVIVLLGTVSRFISAKNKDKVSSLEHPMGSIFPTLGLKRVLQYILFRKSKIIPYLSSVVEPGLCFSHRMLKALALCKAGSKSMWKVCHNILLRTPQRHLFSLRLSKV